MIIAMQLSQRSNEPLQYQDSYVVIHCLKCPAGIVKGRRRLWARSRNSLVAILPRLLTLPWVKWVREGEMWSFLFHVDVADIVWDVDWTVQTTVIEVRCILNWNTDGGQIQVNLTIHYWQYIFDDWPSCNHLWFSYHPMLRLKFYGHSRWDEVHLQLKMCLHPKVEE